MKKTLFVLGTVIVVGAVGCAVWYKINKANQTVERDCENKKDNNNSATLTTVIDNVAIKDEIEAVKSAVTQNMVARHKETAQIMKDAVDIICKRSEVSDDETKKLEQISSELDDLLKED